MVIVELEFRLNRTAYENKTFEWRLRVFNPFKQIIDVFLFYEIEKEWFDNSECPVDVSH